MTYKLVAALLPDRGGIAEVGVLAALLLLEVALAGAPGLLRLEELGLALQDLDQLDAQSDKPLRDAWRNLAEPWQPLGQDSRAQMENL